MNVTGKNLVKVCEEFLTEDSLGHSQGETLLNLMTTDIDDAEPMDTIVNTTPTHKVNNNQARLTDPETADSHTIPIPPEEWPDLNLSAKSYKDAVMPPKEPVPDKDLDNVPASEPLRLRKGSPQIIQHGRGRGHGRGNCARGRQSDNRFHPVQLSAAEQSFLQSKGGISRNNSYSSDPGRKTTTSTPKKKGQLFGSNSSLSPSQMKAMAILGLLPGSDFVKNIVASQAVNHIYITDITFLRRCLSLHQPLLCHASYLGCGRCFKATHYLPHKLNFYLI